MSLSRRGRPCDTGSGLAKGQKEVEEWITLQHGKRRSGLKGDPQGREQGTGTRILMELGSVLIFADHKVCISISNFRI